jgi:putative oxidoreductase
VKQNKANQLLIKSGNFVQKFLLLFFRLNWGWQFYLTGQGKLAHHQRTTEFFTMLHIPFPDLTAWLVAAIEYGGGLLLMAGLGTRAVGLILTINMIAAYMTVASDRQTVFNFFKDQTPFLQADPFFFLLTALMMFSFGAGPISIDAIIAKFIRRKKNKGAKMAPKEAFEE